MTLLALFVTALVLAGCGGAASGGDSPQASGEDERASQSDAPEKSAEGPGKPERATGGSEGGRTSKERLGHPALGAAEAPVVLTEYSDYQ